MSTLLTIAWMYLLGVLPCMVFDRPGVCIVYVFASSLGYYLGTKSEVRKCDRSPYSS